MIVQPASLGPSGRPRRVLRIVGLVVPVVLLAGIVGAAVLGPPPTSTNVPPSGPTVAVASPAAAETAAPSPAATPGVAVFPARFAGLDVHGVRWTVEARNRGLARGVVAVAGYLGLDAVPEVCRDRRLGVFGAFCRRVGVLAEAPWSGAAHESPDPAGFHLHPQFPKAVRIPSQAAFVALSSSTATPPVIVLARFSDPRAEPCIPEGRHCGQELVVERVVWVDGTEFPTTPTADPRAYSPDQTQASLSVEAASAAATLPAGGYPLLAALVDPITIRDIEPDAATAASRLSGPVWFVRGLHERGDPSRIDWRLVTPDGRLILAEGSVATASFPDTADAGG
jgi:hypothetical protein